jgi:hypothetical protein
VTSLQIKKSVKKTTFLALTNEDFFKILKTLDDLTYLAKFVEQLLSKTHLDASESAI